MGQKRHLTDSAPFRSTLTSRRWDRPSAASRLMIAFVTRWSCLPARPDLGREGVLTLGRRQYVMGRSADDFTFFYGVTMITVDLAQRRWRNSTKLAMAVSPSSRVSPRHRIVNICVATSLRCSFSCFSLRVRSAAPQLRQFWTPFLRPSLSAKSYHRDRRKGWCNRPHHHRRKAVNGRFCNPGGTSLFFRSAADIDRLVWKLPSAPTLASSQTNTGVVLSADGRWPGSAF
jgi:hypothetical protein